MKTIIVALIATFSALSAFASPPPMPLHVLLYGAWTTDHPIHQGNVLIWTRFDFSEDNMTLHATCEFQNPSTDLIVGVSSQIAYEGNFIYINENNHGSVNDGYRYCNANLTPSTWEFYFADGGIDHAVLFAPVPYQMSFHVSRVAPPQE